MSAASRRSPLRKAALAAQGVVVESRVACMHRLAHEAAARSKGQLYAAVPAVFVRRLSSPPPSPPLD